MRQKTPAHLTTSPPKDSNNNTSNYKTSQTHQQTPRTQIDADTIEQLKKQLEETQKLLRKLSRRDQKKWQRDHEQLLEQATKDGRKAEQQKLIRTLAGKNRGILQRRFDQLPLRKPTTDELLEVASTPAKEGGLSGTNINIENERNKWKEHAQASPPARETINRDHNIDWLIHKELNRTIRTLKKTKKRKASPKWSAPTELIILALDPDYCSMTRQHNTGLGHPSTGDKKYNSCRDNLKKY